MSWFTAVWIAALLIAVGVRCWVLARQTRHASKNRLVVPPAFADSVTPEAHARAADYSVAGTRTAFTEALWDGLTILLVTLGGFIGWLDGTWRDSGLPRLLSGTVAVCTMLTVATLLSMPFDYYRTFVIEERFGFNKTTRLLFFVDMAKSLVFSMLLMAPLVAAILWLMRSGDWWWLVAWGAYVAFSLLGGIIWPLFVAPRFNKFRPLDDAATEERILALLQSCEAPVGRVFVMDASRRSAHGNAYFVGFGASRRIVIFDTLLDGLDAAELDAVVAHEVGHAKLGHVKLLIAISACSSLVAFALLGWVSGRQWFYEGLGVDLPSDSALLMLAITVLYPLSFPLQPLMRALSRRFEFAADRFGAVHAGPENLIAALLKLREDNATTLTADPVYSAFFHGHPPMTARIAALQSPPAD